MKTNSHQRLAGYASAIGLIIIGIVFAWGSTPSESETTKPTRPKRGTAFGKLRLQVDEGTETAAREYYTGRVASETKFPFRDPLTDTTVANLLAYLKYPELTAVDLHALSSEDLTKKGQPGEILATRFFAPKITDVTNNATPPAVPAGGFGWRKLVRLKARPQSTAEANGVEMAWFLQNITDDDVSANPFDPKRRVSKFNQVILTRKGAPAAGQSGGWFLTFGALVKANGNVPVLEGGQFIEEGRLNFGLDATFDEYNRDPETNSNPRTYYVPAACAVCHGSQSKPKINYLDTDHWFDRVTPAYGIDAAEGAHFQKEDFTGLAASPHGLIYDGGKDRTTPQFKRAFGVIRALNSEIEKQNASAGGQNFQRRAVEKWLQLHATNEEHIPPYRRGFGDAPWRQEKLEHRKLLYYFNRFCYRCHSSVAYHVMDRKAVLGALQNSDMVERLKDRSDPSFWMPQDRIFPGLQPNPQDLSGPGIPTGQLEEFLKLLEGLRQEPSPTPQPTPQPTPTHP